MRRLARLLRLLAEWLDPAPLELTSEPRVTALDREALATALEREARAAQASIRRGPTAYQRRRSHP
jgi:hypothetical protein